MRRIERRDLDCLSHDLERGGSGYALDPHPNIWGRHCSAERLEELLRAAKLGDSLREALVVAHLLYPQRTPAWVKPWLLRNAFSVTGADLGLLDRARWRDFFVPVADEHSGYLWRLLVGIGSDLPLVATAGAKAFTLDSLRALEVVSRLVQEKWEEGCCFGLASPGVSGPVISGQSLGLPCYLAAAACIEGLPDTQILSTGQLDEFGEVLPVKYVQTKVNSANSSFKLIIYPQGSEPPESRLECVPVAHACEALAVMACYQPGMGNKIVQAENALRSGRGLAREICSFQNGMVSWLMRNRQAISEVVTTDTSLAELVTQLKRWCDSTLQCEPELGRAVLQCLPLELVKKVAVDDALLAWTICVLQMDRMNHTGSLPEFEEWRAQADELRPRIVSTQDAASLLALHYVQSVIGDRHNRYVFSVELPEDEDAMFEVGAMEETFRRHQAGGGRREDGRLGRYYGTIGQNYGFCGPDFLGETLRYLELAISCFCADSQMSEKERNRDLLYKVFALSSAGRTDDALETLSGIPRLWMQGRWNLGEMDQYQLHALLRAHVDSGNGMRAALLHEISDLWRSQRKRSHPWQLIAYNLGLLESDKVASYHMLSESQSICLSPETGPTIKVMALLPLAQLHSAGYSLSDMDDQVRRAIAPVCSKDLSGEHFACLMQARTTEEVLRIVQKEKARLFPYSYR